MTGLTGAEIGEGTDAKTKSRILLGSFLFVLGFSIVFVAYGAAFGALGTWLLQWREPLMRVMGVFVIVLGLSFMEVLPAIPGLNRDVRVHTVPTYSLWGAPVLGFLFGLGWSPCIGPTLAAVQSLAFHEGSAWRGALLSLVYCLGLGLPFIILGLAFRYAMGALTWVKKHYLVIMRIGGSVLVIIGVLLVLGTWSEAMVWLRTVMPGITPSL
jgi:cytochrome c-type biogenesis protein